MIGHENVTCGVYIIRNKKTGQIYVGQSINIERRFSKHCNISPIDMAIANEGVENFDFDIIEEVDQSLLLEREKAWINYYGAEKIDRHYNVGPGRIGKYTLWDTSYCEYDKNKMCREDREPDLCRCFYIRYDGYRIPIGVFHDFTTINIINGLIQEAIKNEIK